MSFQFNNKNKINIDIYYVLEPVTIIDRLLGIFLIPLRRKNNARLTNILKDILWLIPYHGLIMYLFHLSISHSKLIELPQWTLNSINSIAIKNYLMAQICLIIWGRNNLKKIERIMCSIEELKIPIHIFNEYRNEIKYRLLKIIPLFVYLFTIDAITYFSSVNRHFHIFMMVYRLLSLQNGFYGFLLVIYPKLFTTICTHFNTYILNIWYNKHNIISAYYFHMNFVTKIQELYQYFHLILFMQLVSQVASAVTCINFCINTYRVIYEDCIIDVFCFVNWLIITMFWLMYLVNSFSTLPIEVGKYL